MSLLTSNLKRKDINSGCTTVPRIHGFLTKQTFFVAPKACGRRAPLDLKALAASQGQAQFIGADFRSSFDSFTVRKAEVPHALHEGNTSLH